MLLVHRLGSSWASLFMKRRIEAMKKVEAPACKKDLQKFLGKVNYLRRFISNLSGKIDAFTPIFFG